MVWRVISSMKVNPSSRSTVDGGPIVLHARRTVGSVAALHIHRRARGALHGLSTRSGGRRSVRRTRPHLHGSPEDGHRLSLGRNQRGPVCGLRRCRPPRPEGRRRPRRANRGTSRRGRHSRSVRCSELGNTVSGVHNAPTMVPSSARASTSHSRPQNDASGSETGCNKWTIKEALQHC